MYMQHERGVSTLVDLYSASLRDAARGLAARREVFTPYGRMLVDELCDWARTLDFGRVVHAVSGTGSAGYVPVA
jgi:hypothetical protein